MSSCTSLEVGGVAVVAVFAGDGSTLVMLFFLPARIGLHHPKAEYGEPLENPTLEEPTPFKLSYLFRSIREVPEMLALMVRTLPSPKPANMTPPL